jgi:hypothetical protein
MSLAQTSTRSRTAIRGPYCLNCRYLTSFTTACHHLTSFPQTLPYLTSHHIALHHITSHQVMLDEGNTFSFDLEKKIIKIVAAWDGSSIHRRSFQIMGFYLSGAPNSKRHWHPLLLYEGPDTNANFRDLSAPYFREWSTLLEDGWFDKNGIHWDFEVS